MARYGALFDALELAVQTVFVFEIVIRRAGPLAEALRVLPGRLERLRLRRGPGVALAASRRLRHRGAPGRADAGHPTGLALPGAAAHRRDHARARSRRWTRDHVPRAVALRVRHPGFPPLSRALPRTLGDRWGYRAANAVPDAHARGVGGGPGERAGARIRGPGSTSAASSWLPSSWWSTCSSPWSSTTWKR